jgi:hypothetical protein
MNDAQLPMALEGGGMAPTKVSETFTPALLEVLELAGDAAEAAQKIRANKQLLAAAMEAYPHLERMTRPLDATQIFSALQDFVIHFGPPKKLDAGELGGEAKDALAGAWAQSWARNLRTLTPEAVALAVDRWMQHGKPFWPAPTELVKLGAALAAEQQKLAYRVRKACESAESRKPPPTAEEKAQVRESLAEFSKQMSARRAVSQEPVLRPAKPNDAAVQAMIRQGLEESARRAAEGKA